MVIQVIFTLITPVSIYLLLEWMEKPEQGTWVGWCLVASLFAARAISFMCYMEVWVR